MLAMYKLFPLSILLICTVVTSIDPDGSHCSSKGTCRECITAGQDCAWCAQDGFSESRCNKPDKFLGKCGHSNIMNPQSDVRILKNEELSDKGAKPGEAVQIKPQEINLTLKPGSPKKFTVKFRQAEDYPLDLYYLMDLSFSMADDKRNLDTLAEQFGQKMNKITKNFRLGFGSYVDKAIQPFSSAIEAKIMEPCKGCAPLYGFIHSLPMSSNSDEFVQKVQSARISGNIDSLEGGLDAVAQIISCKERIGWREKSRKLLVYTSDDGSHYAGDGKLGGVMKPNDGQCHLDVNGNYTESNYQDYPSLVQINNLMKDNRLNIIFAVTENVTDIYSGYSQALDGSSVGILDGNSSNILQLIQEQYDKITSSVELKDNFTNAVSVTYYSLCLNGTLSKTNTCRNLKVGSTVEFEVETTLLACPEDPKEWNRTVQIYAVGLNDYVTVHLQMICECECEKPWKKILNSNKCSSGKGTYECGICNCNENRYGRLCECDALAIEVPSNEKSCYSVSSTKPCSGRGICYCGTCVCNKREDPKEQITGQYCQCDNFSCDRWKGEICGGSERGVCVCGKCRCHPGWSGDDCSCSDDYKGCIGRDGTICSGHGECVCGSCRCNSTDDEDTRTGQYCEKECMECPGKCNVLRDCVEYRMFPDDYEGQLTADECSNDTFFLKVVPKLELLDDELGDAKLCMFRDKNDCKYFFKYKFNENNIAIVYVQETKECPEPPDVLAIVLGVIGGILAVGVAILLTWKLLTTIQDRRELARFEKERQTARWDRAENPLYINATSTYKNPTFGQKD